MLFAKQSRPCYWGKKDFRVLATIRAIFWCVCVGCSVVSSVILSLSGQHPIFPQNIMGVGPPNFEFPEVVFAPNRRDDFVSQTAYTRVHFFFNFRQPNPGIKKFSSSPPPSHPLFISGNPEIQLIADRLLAVPQYFSLLAFGYSEQSVPQIQFPPQKRSIRDLTGLKNGTTMTTVEQFYIEEEEIPPSPSKLTAKRSCDIGKSVGL